MKLTINVASTILLFEVIMDLLLSVYLSILADKEIALAAELSRCSFTTFHCWIQDYKYNFLISQLDFILFVLLRVTILLGALVGVIKNRYDGPERIKSSAQLAFCLFLTSLIFSPLKLLALCECFSNVTPLPKFWLNFCGNIIFSIFGFLIWNFVLANILPKLHSTPGNYIAVEGDNIAGQAAENESDHLLDNGQSGTSVNANNDRKKSIDKKNLDLITTSSVLWNFCKYSRKRWYYYVGGFTFLVLYSTTRMFVPYYMGLVVDSVKVDSYSGLMSAVMNVALLSCFSAIFAGFRGGCFEMAMNRLNLRIRSELFGTLVKQEIGFFDITNTGEMTSRLTADCQTLADTLTLNLNIFLRNAIMLVGSLVMMFKLCWQMALLLLMLAPLCFILTKIFGSIFARFAKLTQDNLAKANEVAEEVLGSMKTVRSFANEEGEGKRYDLKLNNVLLVLKKRVTAYTIFSCLGELATSFIFIITIFYGGHLVLSKKVTAAVLVSFLFYELLLVETIESMELVYSGLMQAAGASKKVFELIDRKPVIKNDGNLAPNSVQGRIEFKNVCFAYPTRPETIVLKNVSFCVEPGEIVALVGPSGGGKSSCISLLEHFYEPISGNVLLDGLPVSEFRHDYFHRKVSLVGQEPVLYARSISENIAYALNDNEYGFDDIVNVSRLANAHQFISALLNGYKTDVGEKGAQLSGGQKQRIAIARAIIRRPKILLLDEATSALDAESEHLIQQALYENLAGYSILLIAHRLSTVKRADRIIVINDGCVVQMGKHEELIKEGGLYRNLVERQLLGHGSELYT